MKSKEEQFGLKIEDPHPCIRTAVAEFPAAVIESRRDDSVRHFMQNTTCAGFRKGKAPKSLVLSRHGEEVDRHLERVLVNEAFTMFVENKGIDFLMAPDIDGDIPRIEPGKDYTLKLKGYVVPPIDLPGYKGISLEKESDEVSEEDVDKEIVRICELYAEFQKVEEAAAADDMLRISYTSDFDPGEDARPSLKRYCTASNTWCILCEPELLPGVIPALLGCKPGEKKRLVSEFPGDFPESELAGRQVTYEMELHVIQRRAPLKSADALKEKMGFEDVGKMREYIAEAMSNSRRGQSVIKAENAALQQVCKDFAGMDIPMGLLSRFIIVELEDMISSTVRTEEDMNKFQQSEVEYRKVAEAVARQKVGAFLVCRRIAKVEDITVKDEELREAIGRLESSSGVDKQRFKQYINRPGRLDSMHVNMLISKVAKFIVANADVKIVPWKDPGVEAGSDSDEQGG